MVGGRENRVVDNVARENLRGRLPEGVLLRVSTIGGEASVALEALRGFAGGLLSHLDAAAADHLTKNGQAYPNMSIRLDQAQGLTFPARFEGRTRGQVAETSAQASYLQQVAGASRALFEAALERVARHEGLSLR